ncbi:MAG: cytochrome c biogenesis protein CcdA [Anaerolineae bacterium]|nr:cytochrome c biogenesis protein CcdA [Anaerolineae bacterium]
MRRYATFLHSLFFVLGFSTIFVALGATASFVGQILLSSRGWVERIGGIIVIIFGLHMMGVIEIPFLYSEKRVHVEAKPGLGYLSSFVIGLSFAAGWTPCVGPVLGAALTWAASTQTVGQGVVMLSVYSLGLGLPFLLTGLVLETASGILRRLNRYMGVISKASGVLLVLMGLLLFTDRLSFLARYGSFFDFESGLASQQITIPIALLAGLLSFASPCVLPLVPAYIGYLSGTSLAQTSGEET